MSTNYLLATPANWFFRRKVPPDLRNIFGRRELKVSLKTGSKQTALKRARVLAYKTDMIFETLRGSSMAGEKINIPGLTELIAESTVTMPNGGTVHRKMEMTEEEFKAMIAAKAINPEIAATILQQFDLILQGQNAAAPVVAMPAVPLSSSDENENIPVGSMKLSAAIEGYMAHGNVMDKWKNKKISSEVEADLQLLLEVMGDINLQNITIARATNFRLTLDKLPSRRKTRGKYKGRSIDDLIKDVTIPTEDRLRNTTVNSIITNCSALFSWAFKGSYNPFDDLKKKERKAKHTLRDAFSDDELLKIFSHETFTGNKPNKVYQYWSPLLGLLTGMRQTEIAQLFLSDIMERDGVYGINIDDEEEGHTIKTGNSRRFVPVHKDLLRLGFRERVDYLLKKGETRLFPELYLWETDPNRDKPETKVYVGQTISKWFNGKDRFLCKLGITSSKLVFHSLRKNFITAMALNGAPEEDRTAIAGHESGTTHKQYIVKFDYPKLKKIIDAVDFSNALQNVVPWNINWR